MFRQQGEAPERAADVAAVLEGGGHVVTQLTVAGGRAAARGSTRDADVIHAIGSAVGLQCRDRGSGEWRGARL